MAYDGVKALGWAHVPNRRGTFYRVGPNGIAFLMIYVGDFMMACHAKDVDALWDPIRARIRLAKPKSLDRFLGCYARRFSAPITEFRDLLSVLPSQWTRLDEDGEKRKVPIP